MLVFWGYHNRLPQTWWLKTTRIYCHSSGGWKSKVKVSAGPCSVWRLQGKILPCFFPSSWWLLAVLGVPWHSLVYSCITVISTFVVSWLSPMCLCLCPNFLLLIRTPVIELGLKLIEYDLIIIWLHLWRPYFQIYRYQQLGLEYIFVRTQFNPSW